MTTILHMTGEQLHMYRDKINILLLQIDSHLRSLSLQSTDSVLSLVMLYA